ncbi:unnamed protein product [Closterium sp. Yama58-4]|nr:unnamed protein product [Closterium sp. Yama58-4]
MDVQTPLQVSVIGSMEATHCIIARRLSTGGAQQLTTHLTSHALPLPPTLPSSTLQLSAGRLVFEPS